MQENSYPIDFFSTNTILIRIAGLWLPGKDVPVSLRILYHLYVFFIYTTTMIFFVCEFLIFGDTIGEVNKFVTHIGMLFTHVVGILKCFILVFRRNRLKNITDALQDKNYQYKPVGDFQPGLRLQGEKKISTAFSILVFVLYGFVGVSGHIASLITINNVVKESTFEKNMTCYDFTPYYFHIPFQTETKRQCGIALAFMDLALDVMAWIIACHDGVFAGLLNCLKTQILIVCDAFRTIRERCLVKLDIPEDYNLYDEDNAELEETLYKELTRCTKHLHLLLQVRDEIEATFTYVTLAQTLASLLIFASCLYVASTVPITSPEFFAQVEYFICVLVQLSLICWFGNEITLASDLIRISLYQSNWYSSSPRFKYSMILTISRMQRPVFLSIGKFTPLTLATLVAVCRGSFSYFTLFKSVQS